MNSFKVVHKIYFYNLYAYNMDDAKRNNLLLFSISFCIIFEISLSRGDGVLCLLISILFLHKGIAYIMILYYFINFKMHILSNLK